MRLRQLSISREGWYYLGVLAFVFAAAIWRDVNLLLILAGMLLGPLLFSMRAVGVTLRGLDVHRRVPEGVCAGDLLVANVRVANTRRRVGSWAIVVEETIEREPSSGEDSGRRDKPIRASIFFPYVPAGESRKGTLRGRLPRRGRYRLGPLRISTRFPFGLLSRTITDGRTETLTVYPRLGRLTRAWAARRREAFAGTHRRERRHGPEGDFYGVREWRPGDSRRWIHPRSSAKLGKLVVRQFEQPRNRDVAVLVDLWQPKKPGADHLENVELAVSFAATVVTDLCRKGGANLLLATDGDEPVYTSGPASTPLLNAAMQQLALAVGRHDDRLNGLLEGALRRIEQGAEVVLVCTRAIDLGDAERLPCLADPNRRMLARRIRCVDASSQELDEYFRAE
jgi:uncharacterized protein (DUF58 family)